MSARGSKGPTIRRPSLGVSMAVKGASLTLRIPVVRDYFLDKLLDRLGKSYKAVISEKNIGYTLWLGGHLGPFLHRLINERPAAARAILRFLGIWTTELRIRHEIREAGGIAPSTVVLEPTDRCNLNCPGCYAKSTADGCDLSYEQLTAIIDQMIELGMSLVTLSGGEPFLREKQEQIISRLARQYPERGFLVYTNGTLIDQPTAQRLGRAGNVFPAISVEGFEHQTDRRRGIGTYVQNRRARRWLRENRVMAGFSATCTRENVESICTDDFIDLRTEEGDLFGWFFLLQPIGRDPRPDLMVTAEQRALLRETIKRWRTQERPIFLGDFWNDGPFTGGCIAGGTFYFHIYANGDISPCVFSPVACGNIFDIISGKSPYSSLSDFIINNPVFKAFRKEQDSITDLARPCLLIDNPEAFRRVSCVESCYAAKNMPPGYVQGRIAEHIEQAAQAWQQKAQDLTPIEDA